jgi:two-component system, NtrC family, sensor kinase
MQAKNSIKPGRLKLHSKTTIVVSIVLIAAFTVIAYFSNLAMTQLSDQRQRDDAQLLATRIANTVEHHIKREGSHSGKSAANQPQETLTPNWSEIEETIVDTIMSTHTELAQVRIFYQNPNRHWQETIRLPMDIGEASPEEESAVKQPLDAPKIIGISEQEHHQFINAVTPTIVASDSGEARQIGAVSVVLKFDQRQSSAVMLRNLLWPLMALAIVATTLSTYFLFRFLVYKPIDNLLLAMSEAEAGNLASEVQELSNDEIGLLTSRFNRMLGHIRQMTDQLNLEQQFLAERVRQATAEIAERKDQLEETNLRLFEMQRQLAQFERLAASGQMAAQFAHEVGTPLNLISGHVQLLRARAVDDKVIHRLDVIAGQIERITKIVRSMLDATRRPQLKLERVDINGLLSQTLEAAQPTFAARNVELTLQMAEAQLFIKADADQLQQVFINLINNSLDAMPQGGGLLVSAKGDGDTVIISISDNGEGIDEDKIDLIFSPLFSTKRERGTGLGLSIVKQIIAEHGGKVKVSSLVGQGTTIRLELPLQERLSKPAAASSATAGEKPATENPSFDWQTGDSLQVEGRSPLE